jgi:hypothetical protein
VIPAGTVCRQDILAPGQLFAPQPPSFREPQDYTTGLYRSVDRIVRNCRTYIGNIWALRAWYVGARVRLMQADPFAEACRQGAIERLGEILEERLKRLKELAGKMPASLELARSREGIDVRVEPFAGQEAFLRAWPRIEERLAAPPPDGTGARERDLFLRQWECVDRDAGYPDAVRSLGSQARSAARSWLQQIVDLYQGDHRG